MTELALLAVEPALDAFLLAIRGAAERGAGSLAILPDDDVAKTLFAALPDIRRAAPEQAEILCLTHREREVVQQVAEGRINKEIAQRLSISVKTVETHRASAMRKLKLRTTADLVRYAVRNQLIQA